MWNFLRSGHFVLSPEDPALRGRAETRQELGYNPTRRVGMRAVARQGQESWASGARERVCVCVCEALDVHLCRAPDAWVAARDTQRAYRADHERMRKTCYAAV